MNITDKELMAIEDRMSEEQVLIRKYRSYAEQCNDAQLKAVCNQVADKHQQHFNMLMGYLQ
ncbi:MAG: spore coat protein [Clostridia bacterium]|nr:spore coat protein [Clostridia bacterium]